MIEHTIKQTYPLDIMRLNGIKNFNFVGREITRKDGKP